MVYSILIGPFSGETVELSIRNDLNEGGNWKVFNRGDTDSNGKISFNLEKGKVRMTIIWSHGQVRPVLGGQVNAADVVLAYPSLNQFLRAYFICWHL